MDLFERLGDAVRASGVMNTPVVYKPLEDVQSISILPVPGGGATRYLNKHKWFTMQFQVRVCSPDQQSAYYDIVRIVKALDGLEPGDVLSQDASFKLNTCEVYSQPDLIFVSEQNNYIYSAVFAAEITY